MPNLWMPGAIRMPSRRGIRLNNNGRRLITWHTFECPYSWSVRQALQFLLNQGTEAFVFHPITGEWGQCQPMSVGAYTLKAQGAATNGYGTVHQQVEVIGYAGTPFTRDLTANGRAGLARGLAFFRQWGVPDQWAWTGVTRPPATYADMLRFRKRAPDRSGHAFHSGWHGGNMHWDPGAIDAPWVAAGGGGSTPLPVPKPAPKPVTVKAGTVLEVTASAGVNLRSGAGTSHRVVAGADRGQRITATGQTSGAWARGYHHPSGHTTGWVHTAHVKVVGQADAAAVKAVQGVLNELVRPAPNLKIDGQPGPATQAAIATYSTTYGYTGPRASWAALTTHMEEIMGILEDMHRTQQDTQARVQRIERRQHDYQLWHERILPEIRQQNVVLGRQNVQIRDEGPWETPVRLTGTAANSFGPQWRSGALLGVAADRRGLIKTLGELVGASQDRILAAIEALGPESGDDEGQDPPRFAPTEQLPEPTELAAPAASEEV